MPFSHLHHTLQSFMPLISKHPFNKALFNGSLPSSVFNNFLIQDHYYLKHYSNALTTIARRLHQNHENHANQFHHIASSIKKTELNMHRRYLHRPQTTQFFKPAKININPAINTYLQHLHETTQTKPIPVAIAAVLPCFVIYCELGMSMPTHAEHRFYDWIKTYSSPSFLNNAEKMIRIFNEHSTGDNQDQALESFITSVQCEIHFWDSCIKPPCIKMSPTPSEGR